MGFFEERRKRLQEKYQQAYLAKQARLAEKKRTDGGIKIPTTSGQMLAHKNFEKAEFWNGEIGLVVRQGDRVISISPQDAEILACSILGLDDV